MITILMAAKPGADPIPLLAFTDGAMAAEILGTMRLSLQLSQRQGPGDRPAYVRFYLAEPIVHADGPGESAETIRAAIGRAVALGGSIR